MTGDQRGTFSAAKLRSTRIEKVMTQTALAKKANKQRKTVYNHEHGLSTPLEVTIGAYARALGVPHTALMDFADQDACGQANHRGEGQAS